jgi:hypothetical protein
VKASKTFCVLVAYTDPQKTSRTSKEAKAMRFALQPNGKSRARGQVCKVVGDLSVSGFVGFVCP